MSSCSPYVWYCVSAAVHCLFVCFSHLNRSSWRMKPWSQNSSSKYIAGEHQVDLCFKDKRIGWFKASLWKQSFREESRNENLLGFSQALKNVVKSVDYSFFTSGQNGPVGKATCEQSGEPGPHISKCSEALNIWIFSWVSVFGKKINKSSPLESSFLANLDSTQLADGWHLWWRALC